MAFESAAGFRPRDLSDYRDMPGRSQKTGVRTDEPALAEYLPRRFRLVEFK